jgi:hypothetical protein
MNNPTTDDDRETQMASHLFEQLLLSSAHTAVSSSVSQYRLIFHLWRTLGAYLDQVPPARQRQKCRHPE